MVAIGNTPFSHTHTHPLCSTNFVYTSFPRSHMCCHAYHLGWSLTLRSMLLKIHSEKLPFLVRLSRINCSCCPSLGTCIGEGMTALEV